MRKLPGGFAPVITLNRGTAKPLHRQIYDGYRTAILEGNLLAGQQLPSTRSLAAELGLSRIPVLNAYAQLLAEGYFETRAGAGTFVSSSLPEQLTSCENRGAGPPTTFSGARTLSQRSCVVGRRESTPWTYGSGAFSVGQLAFDHFPLQIWSNIAARHARKVKASSLNYGDSMGSEEFREAIASYLRTARGLHCEARQVMVVSGSQQALDLCARVLLDPGSRVWVEEPGYQLMRHALTMAGCDLVPVPVDEDGLDVAAGVELCSNANAAYVTPSHQFPLGVTMGATRRLQLLAWARRSGAWIIEDDYDSEYRYESLPIASLQGLDRDARVIYIGTFSKTLFPSLRIGYLVIPSDLVDRFAAVRRLMDIFPPSFNQAVAADFMTEGHFARHVRKTRLLYGERRTALVDAIRGEFGSHMQILGAEAGMHLVVTLPKLRRDEEISRSAAQQKLWLWPLSAAYSGKAVRQGFILGFGSTEATEMPRAVSRLRDVLLNAGWS
jgi:GntR family transcriptional regulator/MocR family aminotransferase